jgi:hypothetical protein
MIDEMILDIHQTFPVIQIKDVQSIYSESDYWTLTDGTLPACKSVHFANQNKRRPEEGVIIALFAYFIPCEF